MTTEYSFKKTDWFVTKQTIPAIKKSAELTIGRQSSAFFSFFTSVLFLPVKLRKNEQARTITHSDKIRTGSFRMTRSVNTSTGYTAAIT